MTAVRAETGPPPPAGVRIHPCGDSAICVEFGDGIDAAVHARVLALDRALAAGDLPGVVETVPTYRSLLVHVDPLQADHGRLADRLRVLAERPAPAPPAPVRWRVPVVYGGEHGVDLAPLAGARGMTAETFIRQHAEAVYRVFMIGFVPGFTYLGGLDPRLAAPRRPAPRARVPRGSIAIGGEQTSIGSMPAPSGWHLIGQTPVRVFDAGRDPPCLFAAGDEIVFDPVPDGEWAALDAAAAAGARIAGRVPA